MNHKNAPRSICLICSFSRVSSIAPNASSSLCLTNVREPYFSDMSVAIFLYLDTEAGEILSCSLPPQEQVSLKGGRLYFLGHFLHLTPCVEKDLRLPMISLMKCFYYKTLENNTPHLIVFFPQRTYLFYLI